MKVQIAGVAQESVTDGPGVRSVIFFQGCPHACPGCHNPQTWDPAGGREYDCETLLKTLVLTPLLSGVTLSGGEPFLQAEAAARIAKFVKSGGISSLRMNVWVYTGFVWEQLLRDADKPGYRSLISLADAIVDGPYRKDLRDLSLPYRGSSNQRILLPGLSLEQGRAVPWNPEKPITP